MNDSCPLTYCAITYTTTGKHAVFGKLLDGFEVLKKIESVGSRSGTPSKSVRIAESGELA
jgi:cyclophilin family peptidyl-prolyl cis-trans isomerase